MTLEQATKIAMLRTVFPEPIKKISKIMNIGEASSNSTIQKVNSPLKSIKSTFSYKDGDLIPTFFIINFNEGGFAIVGGDDRVRPILAYSDKSSFPTDKEYPLPLADWLKANHEGIKYMRSSNKPQAKSVKSDWDQMQAKSDLSLGKINIMTSLPECDEEGEQYVETLVNGPLMGIEITP